MRNTSLTTNVTVSLSRQNMGGRERGKKSTTHKSGVPGGRAPKQAGRRKHRNRLTQWPCCGDASRCYWRLDAYTTSPSCGWCAGPRVTRSARSRGPHTGAHRTSTYVKIFIEVAKRRRRRRNGAGDVGRRRVGNAVCGRVCFDIGWLY